MELLPLVLVAGNWWLNEVDGNSIHSFSLAAYNLTLNWQSTLLRWKQNLLFFNAITYLMLTYTKGQSIGLIHKSAYTSVSLWQKAQLWLEIQPHEWYEKLLGPCLSTHGLSFGQHHCQTIGCHCKSHSVL